MRSVSCVKDHAASQEKVSVRTERESRGLAVLHRKGIFHLGGLRIDSLDCPISLLTVHFWYGDIEPAGVRVPPPLVPPIGGLRRRNPVHPPPVFWLLQNTGDPS